MERISEDNITRVRVSSVLNKDVNNYGKKNIFDGCSDTCWNSDKGKPQWVTVELNQWYNVAGFDIEFQGGFVGQYCQAEIDVGGVVIAEPFYPEDVNGVQKFTLTQPRKTKSIRFFFNESTDFFGRIVIYSITLFKDDLSHNNQCNDDN